VPVEFRDLPGWGQDRLARWWSAWNAGCQRPAPVLAEPCAESLLRAPAADDAAIAAWITARFRPYRIEAADGTAAGLLTGYYEPLVDARRRAGGAFRVPLYAQPERYEAPRQAPERLEASPEAAAASPGCELAWLEDPVDALMIQVQGSARLNLTEADGTRRLVRMAFAGHNEHPYRSVARWLAEQGELRLEAASWSAVRAWAHTRPERLDELLRANPRRVFFREEPLPDPEVGPRGAAGVPLTPRRSVAVDPGSVPFGTPLWLDSTLPQGGGPLRRLVMAQDTGVAITGAVRADYFWGWGPDAQAQASRTMARLRLWALWPRGHPLP
jgi:membrane-bound lytic murein transglycosylase A